MRTTHAGTHAEPALPTQHLARAATAAGLPGAQYAYFRNTGLERGPALAKDIEWMAETYGLEVPRLKEDGSGAIYSAYLREIAENDPQAFICHWYNQYFAHTAGGLMIGRKMSQELIDGKTLEFYQWDGDVQEFLVA